jgi:hypothetical protein
MINYDDARDAAEFHVARDGQPCQVWQRAGEVQPMPGGGWLVFIETDATDEAGRPSRDWWHITRATADGYHTAADCPRNLPSVGASADQAGPDLASVVTRDADGYSVFGFDAEGYDRDGYDAQGYDRDGYDRDGYDEDGDDRYGRNRNPAARDLDLDEEWARFAGYQREEFLQHLRDKVSDPDEVDEIEFCDNCSDPVWDTSRAGNGRDICESCWEDWYTCDHCDDRFPSDDMNSTLDEGYVCDSCLRRYYSFCDSCDGYYADEYSDDHDHNSGYGCECESPAMEFTVGNGGGEPLRNDTRVTIELTSGVISTEGLQAIRDYLRDNVADGWAIDLGALGDEWQTRTGNYAKRLSRYVYQQYQTKLTPEDLSAIGQIARNHSESVSVAIEVTRDLNMSPSDFYHDDSCWWACNGDYEESRCALKSNGGFALRSFNGRYDGYVSGRAWVMPLKLNEDGKLRPTFNTRTPDAFVVFNGYGDLSGYAGPRVIAHMAGLTYRKIGFGCGPMYINSGGYLIAPEEIAQRYSEDRSLYLDVSTHASLYDRERELTHV